MEIPSLEASQNFTLGLSIPRIVAFTISAPSEWVDRGEWCCLTTGAKGKIQA